MRRFTFENLFELKGSSMRDSVGMIKINDRYSLHVYSIGNQFNVCKHIGKYEEPILNIMFGPETGNVRIYAVENGGTNIDKKEVYKMDTLIDEAISILLTTDIRDALNSIILKHRLKSI